MVKLNLTQLKDLLMWASKQKDKKGKSLLERARESLLSGSYIKYNTTIEISDREILEDGTPIIYWDCTCPSANRRKNKNKPCKHVIARLILSHEQELSQNPKWAQWFEQYHNKQLEQALRAFSQF